MQLSQGRRLSFGVCPFTLYVPRKKAEVLQVSVEVLILQQLTSDEVVAQAELRHGQYLSFVRRGVAGRAHQVIPVLSTGDGLTLWAGICFGPLCATV